MKKLRLLLTPKCNRSCAGCCNKDWDLDALPICTDFAPYDEVLITGGEPMLFPDLVDETCWTIREQILDCRIILYTANPTITLVHFLESGVLDGVTLTLHEQSDVDPFEVFDYALSCPEEASLRLNVFEGIEIAPPLHRYNNWVVKSGMVWIKDCPLPEGEVLMRLEEA